MLCSNLHCQKGFLLILFSCKIWASSQDWWVPWTGPLRELMGPPHEWLKRIGPPQDRQARLGTVKFNAETLIIHKLSSWKFTTRNDLSQKSKRVVILIETKLVNNQCLQMKLPRMGEGKAPAWLRGRRRARGRST